MIRLALADLRDSWVAWVGVSLTFVVTNAALATCLIFADSVTVGIAAGTATGEDIEAVRALPYLNLVLTCLVALAVIGAATNLVVSARRSAIARLLLGGATPGQLVRFLGAQLVVVALAGAIVGDLVALAVTPTVIDAVARDRGVTVFAMSVDPATLLSANLGCVALSVIGGLRQARAASRIPPVEALREASSGSATRLSRASVVLRWLRFGLIALLVVAAFPGYRAVAPELGSDALAQLMQLAVVLVPLAGLALAAIMPWIVGPLTSGWTRLVPGGAAWHLARHTVVAKADRMVRSVLPIMFATGLGFGMLMIGDTLVDALRIAGGPVQISGAGPMAVLTTIGLALAVSVAGSVGNLVMMSRQRSAELALGGIVGASPGQQVLVPALEALILTVTAAALGFVMAATGASVLAYGLAITLPGASVSFPWAMLGWTALGCLVVALLATVLPVLTSLREPAPRVLARLVGA